VRVGRGVEEGRGVALGRCVGRTVLTDAVDVMVGVADEQPARRMSSISIETRRVEVMRLFYHYPTRLRSRLIRFAQSFTFGLQFRGPRFCQPGDGQMRLSIIIPAYNEEQTIASVIHALVNEVQNLFEIIVVDDGSQDRTAELAEQLCQQYSCLRVIRQPRNMGKTAALRTGFAASSGEVVVVQDADLEYDPADINGLVEPITLGKADVVYGSRFMIRRASRVLYFRHFMANQFLTFLSNLFTDLNLSDVETGYKAFRGEIIRNMLIETRGFGFEIEVTAKVAKLKCRVFEVPISYYGRTYEEGKKIGFKDGLDAIFYIFKYNLFVSREKSYKRQPDLGQRTG
jgi:glycosyltransferase involved in cell wall biosynthesis